VSFDPLDFVQLGRQLGSRVSDEASIRTAISRAYYGVFLLARERTGTRSRSKVHERVEKKVGVKIGTRAAHQFNSFRVLRCQADYDLSPSMTARHWQRAESIANHLLPQILRI